MSKLHVIEAIGKNEADILLYGVIGAEVTASAFTRELVALEMKYKRINVRINSVGGSVFEGIAIYNAIVNSRAEIHTYNDGIAASMGSVVLQAGKKVFMARNARLMTHKPSGHTNGQAHKLRETADLLDCLEKDLIATYVRKTGKTEDEVKAWMQPDKDAWFTAAAALNAKLIDGIIEPRAKSAFIPENLTRELMDSVMMNYQSELQQYISTTPNMNLLAKLVATLSLKGVNNVEDESAVLNAIQNSFTHLSDENTQLKAENTQLKTDAEKLKAERVKNLVSGAISAGKVPEAMRATYEQLAGKDYDAAKAAIDGIPAPKNLTSHLGGKPIENPRDKWTWNDWSKNNPVGLGKMKREQPENYQALYDAQFNNK